MDTPPVSEGQRNAALVNLQNNLLSRADFLRRVAPSHHQLPTSPEDKRLIAQQRVQTDAINGVLNVHLTGNENTICTDAGVALQTPQDRVILGLVNSGSGVFDITVEQNRISVALYPDRGVDFRKLGFPETQAFPPTFSFDLGNPHYTETDLAPLNALYALVNQVSGPDSVYLARLTKNGVTPAPAAWPVDRSVPFIDKDVKSIRPEGEMVPSGEKRIMSRPEHVGVEEKQWMEAFLREMTPQNALEWLTHSADTLTRHQLQLAREAISSRIVADQAGLAQALQQEDQDRGRQLFTGFLTDTYAQKVFDMEELDRNFKLNPTPNHATRLAEKTQTMLEVRHALQELVDAKPGSALMNYILKRQESIRKIHQENLDLANENATTLPDALFKQASFTRGDQEEIALWDRAYKLYFS